MNLADPQILQRLLARHGRRAEKGLGQHFLVSQPVVDAIVGAASGLAGILEIGPGPGVLTSRMSEVAQVIALEVDAGMLPVLAESSPSAEIRNEDALKADYASALEQLPEPRGIVSNLPYYITGPLLERISAVRSHISVSVLMMQKEVGQRIVAPVGNSNRGALSVSLQCSFAIEKVCDVPPDSFLPPPKVDSIVLKLVPKQDPLAASEMPGFLAFVRHGFAMPRKTIFNNLSAGKDRAVVAETLERLQMDPRTRPQYLSEEQWIQLYEALG